jgi:hypothetical protein
LRERNGLQRYSEFLCKLSDISQLSIKFSSGWGCIIRIKKTKDVVHPAPTNSLGETTMKGLMLAGLSALVLGSTIAAIGAPIASVTHTEAASLPPSGDSNPSDLGNRTVDTSQIIASLPPSGDSNPSDLGNRTVDTSQIIASLPPSGDSNPSDLGNRTVDTSQIIASLPPSGDSNPSDLGNRTVDTSQIIARA